MNATKMLFFSEYFLKIVCISIIIIFLIASCTSYTSTIIKSSDRENLLKEQTTDITIPAKVHLPDGSMIFFEKGFKVSNDMLIGRGVKYNITRSYFSSVKQVQIDSIVYVQYYEENAQKSQNLALTTSSILVSIGAFWAAIYKALGSIH